MIREVATITEIGADYLLVTTELKTGCSGCAQQTTCGAGIISKAFSDRRAAFRVQKPDTGDFHEGQTVELLLPEQMLTRASLLIYGAPLVVLILSAATLQGLLGINEGFSIIASLIAFGASFWALKRWFKMRDLQVSQLLQVQQIH